MNRVELVALLAFCSLSVSCINQETCGTWYVDGDGDGYFGLSNDTTCAPAEGATNEEPEEPDCDDGDADIHPDLSDGDQDCDGVDNDCDDLTDEDQLFDGWYVDEDGDGYGDAGAEIGECDREDGVTYVQDATDCDDGDADRHPEQVALDVCGDGVDEDCVGGDEDACALQGTVDLTKLNAVTYEGTVAVALGDVDDDDLMDFAVGNPATDTVTIYASKSGEAVLEGDAGSGFGTALAAGYFNKDGKVDLAVGAPGANSGAGEVGLYTGGPEFSAGPVVAPGSSFTEFGAALSTVAGAAYDGLAIAETVYLEPDYQRYVRVLSDPAGVASTSDDVTDLRLGTYATNASWPLSLASDVGGTGLVVGASEGVGEAGPGARVFSLPITSSTTTPITKLVEDSSSGVQLGASVLLESLSSDKSFLATGAPGGSEVVGIVGPFAASYAPDSTGTLHWTSAASNKAGTSISLSADIDGDGDAELAIGGKGQIWLVFQTSTGLADGPLEVEAGDDTIPAATATITGFTGLIRSIVGPGDVNGDGYGDLLVSDSANTYLLYGGPAVSQ